MAMAASRECEGLAQMSLFRGLVCTIVEEGGKLGRFG